MRRVLIVVAGVLLAGSGARAAEITVKANDADQQAFANLPGAVDACVAGLTLRGDGAMCKLISQFVTEFAGKVKAAAPAAEKITPVDVAK